MALLHSAAARLLPYGGVRQRQGFGIVLPSDPPAPEEPEYVEPDGRIQGSRTLGKYGGYDSCEHPDSEFSQCYYNYFCLCNKSSHTLTVAVSSKEKYRWVFTTGNKIYP